MLGIGIGIGIGWMRDSSVKAWDTEDCIGFYSVPPYGTYTSAGGVISQWEDVQPESSYPTGKTGPFDLTSSGANQPEDDAGTIYGPDNANYWLESSDAELMAFVSGSDTPFTVLSVNKLNQAVGGPADCLYFHQDWWGQTGNYPDTNPRMRMGLQGGTEGGGYRVGRHDGVINVQYSLYPAYDDSWIVTLWVYSGTTLSMYSSDGYTDEAHACDTNSITFTLFRLAVSGGRFKERAMWARALTEDERILQMGRAAAAHSIPFLLSRYDVHRYTPLGYVDDGYQTVTASTLDAKRAEAIAWLWGTDGVPSATPDITEDVAAPLGGLSDLEQIDRYEYTDSATSDGGAISVWSVGHLYRSSATSTGKLVFVIHGHGHYADGAVGLDALIQAELTAGTNVFALHMICEETTNTGGKQAGWPAGGSANGHIWLGDHVPWAADEGSYIRLHLNPAVVALNQLASLYSQIHVSGISGGGWTTRLLAALDDRVDYAYPVAAGPPNYMRIDDCAGHAELLEPRFYEMCTSPMIDALAARSRVLTHYFLKFDAYFSLANWDDTQCSDRVSGMTWYEAIDDMVSQTQSITGAATCSWVEDTTAVTHEMSAETAAAIAAQVAAT